MDKFTKLIVLACSCSRVTVTRLFKSCTEMQRRAVPMRKAATRLRTAATTSMTLPLFTFHIDGALVRTLIGKDLKRAYQISENRLTVRSTDPKEHWEVVWERY